MDERAAVDRLERRLRAQAGRATQRNSPLYVALLERVADDVAARGPAWALLRGRAGERGGEALPLRLMAAVHRLVLSGEAPALAGAYPSAGGDGDPERAWPALRELLAERADELDGLLDEPLQTNEPGRAAALLPGFLAVARDTGLPLRVLEIGASAGLNLNWDRYRYVAHGFAFGPEDSPVRIDGFYEGPAPASAPPATRVTERTGCDRRPLDARSEHDRLVLRSAVWADQEDRLALLDAALEVARRHPPPVERAEALGWLEARLSAPAGGIATVVVHSIVVQYLEPQARAALHALLGEAGARARAEAPLAWLRLEPPEREPAAGDPTRGLAEIRLTRWPGGDESLLGHAGYHGRPVRLGG